MTGLTLLPCFLPCFSCRDTVHFYCCCLSGCATHCCMQGCQAHTPSRGACWTCSTCQHRHCCCACSCSWCCCSWPQCGLDSCCPRPSPAPPGGAQPRAGKRQGEGHADSLGKQRWLCGHACAGNEDCWTAAVITNGLHPLLAYRSLSLRGSQSTPSCAAVQWTGFQLTSSRLSARYTGCSCALQVLLWVGVPWNLQCSVWG